MKLITVLFDLFAIFTGVQTLPGITTYPTNLNKVQSDVNTTNKEQLKNLDVSTLDQESNFPTTVTVPYNTAAGKKTLESNRTFAATTISVSTSPVSKVDNQPSEILKSANVINATSSTVVLQSNADADESKKGYVTSEDKSANNSIPLVTVHASEESNTPQTSMYVGKPTTEIYNGTEHNSKKQSKADLEHSRRIGDTKNHKSIASSNDKVPETSSETESTSNTDKDFSKHSKKKKLGSETYKKPKVEESDSKTEEVGSDDEHTVDDMPNNYDYDGQYKYTGPSVFSYFTAFLLISFLFYILYQNRRKVFAYVAKGSDSRRKTGTRRGQDYQYEKISSEDKTSVNSFVF